MAAAITALAPDMAAAITAATRVTILPIATITRRLGAIPPIIVGTKSGTSRFITVASGMAAPSTTGTMVVTIITGFTAAGGATPGTAGARTSTGIATAIIIGAARGGEAATAARKWTPMAQRQAAAPPTTQAQMMAVEPSQTTTEIGAAEAAATMILGRRVATIWQTHRRRTVARAFVIIAAETMSAKIELPVTALADPLVPAQAPPRPGRAAAALPAIVPGEAVSAEVAPVVVASAGVAAAAVLLAVPQGGEAGAAPAGPAAVTAANHFSVLIG